MNSDDPSPSKPLPEWDVASLIDLEYLNEEADTQGKDLKNRDRGFYLKLKGEGTLTPELLTDRSAVLRHWVEDRRKSREFHEPGPGETIAEALAAFRFWGFVGCLLIGAMFAWGALNISGKQVNVILFWFLTVGLPLVFTILGFYLLLGERLPGLPAMPGVLRIWLGRWIVKMAGRTTRLIQRRTSQEHTIRMSRFGGQIKRHTRGRGHYLVVALGSLLHLLGLGLVTGIFVAIVLFRSFSYQDYGWQTHSGWLTVEKVHSIVRVVSTPWTWLEGEGEGYPTQTQIGSTRIFRNNSSVGENAAASVTWSSFLLWSSLFYGVLPRIGLLLLGRLHLRRALASEDFHRFDALWRRFTIPDIIIEPPPEDPFSESEHHPTAKSPGHLESGSSLLLIPEAIAGKGLETKLKESLLSQDLEFKEIESLPYSPSDRQRLLESLTKLSKGVPSRLLVLQESFMPPNESFVRFLKKARETLGDRLPIHVILLHAADSDESKNHSIAWHARMDPLGDRLISMNEIRITTEPPNTPS